MRILALFCFLPAKLDNYDYVCQEYRYQCIQKPNLTYYVFRIFRATDKDLKQFIGKALVQKVSAKHQALTEPEDVISFMLGNKVPDVNQ